MGAFLRDLARRSGLPLTMTARRAYRYLAQYYPPAYYHGYIEKVVGFHAILRAADETALEGDVVECGIGRGLTFYILGHFMAGTQSGRHLYGFDSFEGFPTPSLADASSRQPVRGDLWSDTSVRHVKDHFRRGGLERFLEHRTSVIRGFFADTLPRATEPARIALLIVDVDLYDSYRDCLRYLGERVTGVIVYDEYRSPKWPGATRAVDEILPALGHCLYYSAVMDRYVSMPTRTIEQPFTQRLIDRLDLRTAR